MYDTINACSRTELYLNLRLTLKIEVSTKIQRKILGENKRPTWEPVPTVTTPPTPL